MTVVHVLGKTPGRFLCGAELASACGQPGAGPCPGCAGNLRRMREADDRQLELVR